MKTIGIRKLRSNSRWLQFTEPERADIRWIFEQDGEIAAVEYCRKIGKPWSHNAISKFFAKERSARRAESIEVRENLAGLKELIAAHTEAGMGIAEATAVVLSAKLRDAVKLSAADPKTRKGRAIITMAAPHVIALRALELREREDELKSKEVELAGKKVELKERQVVVQEKKATEARPVEPEFKLTPEEEARRVREIFGRNEDGTPMTEAQIRRAYEQQGQGPGQEMKATEANPVEPEFKLTPEEEARREQAIFGRNEDGTPITEAQMRRIYEQQG
jgi:hypothetical protein